MDPPALMIQNMMLLCKQLRLPVSYKVHERVEAHADGAEAEQQQQQQQQDVRRFAVVVHVHGDHAFKKYLNSYSCSDLLLYRGLLLQVDATPDLSRVLTARVQQAFLPKFENEGQDAAIADAVAAGAAAGRPTVVTVKHSGSLITLSPDGGWAAKNSIGNDFTAGGAALLRAHYDRRHPHDPAAAAAALERLFAVLRERRVALSFEMVTACHGHHGQLPAAEYLVTTAAHGVDPATGAPAFLGWLPFLELCAEVGLPLNDTWIVYGSPMAQAARQALDALALRGGPTSTALRALGQLVAEGGAEGCLHLPGTYPHDQWQGERIEGFVVAQGQALGEEDVRRLRALRDRMSAACLPLASVPEHLRRPYQAALRAALSEAAAAKAATATTAAQTTDGGGGSNGVGGDGAAQGGGGSSDAVRAKLQAAAAAWVPQAAVAYRFAQSSDRDKVLAALTDQGMDASEHPYIAAGQGRLYSRRAVSMLDAQRLEALLTAEAAAATDPGRAAALRSVAGEAAMAADGASSDALQVRAMRALAGEPETAVALRYKKKMQLWSFGDAASRTAAAAVATDSDANGEAGSSGSGGSDGVVGYSLMTFVIRNGLAALQQGESTYLSYVDNLTRRSWGLPPALASQVMHFARCWAAWVGARGGAASVQADRYLDVAEPFAAAFLRQRGAMQLSGRSADAFQGVLVCVDTSEALTAALRRAVAPSLELSTGRLGDTVFSKGMVPGGAMLWVQPNDAAKQLRGFLAPAAPFAWVVAAAPPLAEGKEEGPAVKKQRGIAASKLQTVKDSLGKDAVESRLRQVTVPDPAIDVDGAMTARLAADLAAWLGRGTPLPPADPAVAAFFITIPGAGKSAIAEGVALEGQEGAEEAAEQGQRRRRQVTVKVLNSDTMKKKVKGFSPSRYWFEVASAADECRGGGHAVVAIADKNLVPSPPGNIARALEPLRGTGVASLALVPSVAGPSTLAAPTPAHADLYAGMPALPFPLELVALCMLRTLRRRNHEGNLDGASTATAATVVAMFAGFYRNKTLPDLTDALRGLFTRVAELPLMRGDAAGSVPLDALAHVAAGIKEVDERSKQQLPPAWEARARELLQRADVAAALEALQLPLGEVRARLQSELGATLDAVEAARDSADGAANATANASLLPAPSLSSAVAAIDVASGASGGAAAAAAPSAEELAARVSYFSVAGIDDAALRAAACGVLPPELHGRLRRTELHVTLWHRSDPELGARSDVRDALASLVGSAVELEVAAIDLSPEVVAAEVRLLSADEAITSKPYHHITLLVEKGHTAAESNQLPARLAAGEPGVERRALPGGPLQLSGVITAVEAPAGGPQGRKAPVV